MCHQTRLQNHKNIRSFMCHRTGLQLLTVSYLYCVITCKYYIYVYIHTLYIYIYIYMYIYIYLYVVSSERLIDSLTCPISLCNQRGLQLLRVSYLYCVIICKYSSSSRAVGEVRPIRVVREVCELPAYNLRE